MRKRRITLALCLLTFIASAAPAQDDADTPGAEFAYRFKYSSDLFSASSLSFMWGKDTDTFLNFSLDLSSLRSRLGIIGELEGGMDFPVWRFTPRSRLTAGWALPLHFSSELDATSFRIDVLATIGLQYRMPSRRMKLYVRFGAGGGSYLKPAFNPEHPVSFVYSGYFGLLFILRRGLRHFL